MTWQLLAVKEIEPMPEGRYRVTITFDGMRSNADIDGPIKQTLDFLEKSGIIKNDSLIDELQVFRGARQGDKKAHIEITKINAKAC
jgi:Holliday junction resolvase RusA-like endonuclease